MPGIEETVAVGAIGHKGDGVADGPGGPVFVAGTLPGETVRILREGERGRLVEVVAASPDRVPAPCPRFLDCGGCSLQHMGVDAYLDFKRKAVADALADRGLDAAVEPVVPVAPGTRRRAVVAVQRQDGRPVAGFRARLSHRVVPAAGCLVVTPAIEAALPGLVRLADLLSFGPKGAVFTLLDTETGLDVAAAEAKLSEPRRQDAIRAALALGLARLSVAGEVIVEARAPIVRFGGAAVAVPLGGFLQAVAPAEAALADAVLAATAGAKRIADLFAGAGTFALRLAERAQVHAVESDRAALAALDKAWRATPGLKPVTTEARDLFRRPLMPAELDRFDAIVFDPPREGAAGLAKNLAKSRVPTVVAVSCNPATLARDLRTLVDAGFSIDRVLPVDQFLWSHHVEAVAVLHKR